MVPFIEVFKLGWKKGRQNLEIKKKKKRDFFFFFRNFILKNKGEGRGDSGLPARGIPFEKVRSSSKCTYST